MREVGQFEYFVIPFLFGMAFVLGYCIIGMVRVILELPKCDRRRFFISLITPKMDEKEMDDLFAVYDEEVVVHKSHSLQEGTIKAVRAVKAKED